MPAPQAYQEHSRSSFNHVNLMVDSFLANAEVDEQVSILLCLQAREIVPPPLTSSTSLRAIIRTTLASCPPSTASAFTAAARKRLTQSHARSRPSGTTSLFQTLDDGFAVPTQSLEAILRRSRAFYGAGMGLASLGVLTQVVQSTLGLRWDLDGLTADILAAVDADISQAIQSSKEELGGGRVSDLCAARMAVRDLAMAVNESLRDCELWGGEFPFERALASVEYWKF